MRYEIWTSAIWATAIVICVAILSSIPVTISNNNHRFDYDCISAGKSVVWETKQGADSAQKECK